MTDDENKLSIRCVSVHIPSDLDLSVKSADVVIAADLPDGTKATGVVTLVEDKINGGWMPCGDSMEHWVDWLLLGDLYDAAGSLETLKAWLGDIAADAAQKIAELLK